MSDLKTPIRKRKEKREREKEGKRESEKKDKSHQRSKEPIRDLDRDVSVPPKGAALVGEVELVGEGLAGGDGALGDARDAVHPDRVPLVDAVPVNGGALLGHVVVDRDADRVARVGLDEGAGGLAVDLDHGLLEPVGRMLLARDVEDILAE